MLSTILSQSHGGLRPPGPKRETLIKILREVIKKTGYKSSSGTCDESVPFAMAEINSDCLGCNVCSTLCPTSALQRFVDDKGRVTIKFLPRFCVNCGLCHEVCLPGSIKLKSFLTLEELMADDYHELIVLEKEKAFLTNSHPSQAEGMIKEDVREGVNVV